MRKLYSYTDLKFPVGDDTEVNFEVKLISDGNIINTAINVPGPNDQLLHDEGVVSLGKGKDLRGDSTVSFSDIINLIPQEDEIRIQYLINGTLLKEHHNMKSEETRPYVMLNIQFPEL
ncbi:MAG: hypothetical protein HKN48_08590 [Flavobacteriaceae bacterium]|nr:hypothetical protein [Flavobacteriaceae bacterium]